METHYGNVGRQGVNKSTAGIISLLLGLIITIGLVITLAACSSRYFVENGIDVVLVGPRVTVKHFSFEGCGVTLEEYQGAASVSLYNCDRTAYLVVSNGEGDKERISGLDEYVFKKTSFITFDLYPDGKHIHVANHKIWPDTMSFPNEEK